jgi:hypothetical protein
MQVFQFLLSIWKRNNNMIYITESVSYFIYMGNWFIPQKFHNNKRQIHLELLLLFVKKEQIGWNDLAL